MKVLILQKKKLKLSKVLVIEKYVKRPSTIKLLKIYVLSRSF